MCIQRKTVSVVKQFDLETLSSPGDLISFFGRSVSLPPKIGSFGNRPRKMSNSSYKDLPFHEPRTFEYLRSIYRDERSRKYDDALCHSASHFQASFFLSTESLRNSETSDKKESKKASISIYLGYLPLCSAQKTSGLYQLVNGGET